MAQHWHLRAATLVRIVLDLVRGRDVAELEAQLAQVIEDEQRAGKPSASPASDSGVQYEENPLQRLPVGQTLAAWEPGTSLHLRQQRSTRFHSPSDTIHGALAIRTTPSLTTDADVFVVRERVPSLCDRQ
jgi:hypothetical protein